MSGATVYDMPCAHGSDDPSECWGCHFGEPIGPHPIHKTREVRQSWSFVESAAALGLVPSLPLARPVPSVDDTDKERQ